MCADLVWGGSRYEGEFATGFASGMGQYTAANGEVYRGEWMYGKRHGCASTSHAPKECACGGGGLYEKPLLW